jgi:hypothetical protein
MRFAIYVRAGEATFDALDTVPEQLRKRTLAVRGFDDGAMMTSSELIEGVKLEEAIERQFANPRTTLSARALCRARLLRRAHRAGVRQGVSPLPRRPVRRGEFLPKTARARHPH